MNFYNKFPEKPAQKKTISAQGDILPNVRNCMYVLPIPVKYWGQVIVIITLSILLPGANPLFAQPVVHELVIDFPQPGAHLFRNKGTLIRAHFEPRKIVEAPIDVTIKATSPNDTILVARGDLRDGRITDAIETVWNMSKVPVGEYSLGLRVVVDGKAYSGFVPVNVYHPPVVSIIVNEMEAGDEGIHVSLRADARSPSDITLDRYIWNLGDGSPAVTTQQPVINYLYRSFYPEVGVSVEVQDVFGGSTLISSRMKLPKAPLFAPIPGLPQPLPGQGCECEQMRILTAGESDYYCAQGDRDRVQEWLSEDPDDCEVLDESVPTNCPSGHVAYACKLEPRRLRPSDIPNYLSRPFEVRATLKQGNTPSHCFEGQFVRSSVSEDGGPPKTELTAANRPPADFYSFPVDHGDPYEFHSLTNPERYPHIGAMEGTQDLWGADGYDHPYAAKMYKPHLIHWYDRPRDLIKTGVQTASQHFEFLTVISEDESFDSPSCWCRFEIKQEWNSNGTQTAPPAQRMNGLRCTVEPPIIRTISNDGLDSMERSLVQESSQSGLFMPPTPTIPPPPDLSGNPDLATPLSGEKPLVFIPGVMGSKLWLESYKDGGHLWGLSKLVWPPLSKRNLKHLNPQSGKALVADGLVPGIYTPLMGYLRVLGYRSTGPDQNLWIYAYDWRISNAASGEGLKRLIDTILSSPQAGFKGWTSVDILNHSMGGIVTRQAIGLGASINKAIYIASPHFGATEAYIHLHPGFANGVGKTTSLFNTISPEGPLLHNFRKMLGNKFFRSVRRLTALLPSAYELLPDSMYLDVGGISMVVGVTGLSNHYYGDFPWQFDQRNQASREVRRAMRFKDQLAIPVPGGPTLVIYSKNKSTRDLTDFNFSPPRALDSGLKGDGTVPTMSANLLNSMTTKEVTGGHKMLPNKPQTWRYIRNHLRTP